MRLRLFVGAWLVVFCSVAGLRAADSEAPLVKAVKEGNRQAVQALLKQQPLDVNAPEPDGTTALHWAAHANDLEMVRMLLSAGADAKAVNRYGSAPLELAAIGGDLNVIEMLLEAGADPNTTMPEGETVLMTAARTGKVDAIRLLLVHGANVNAQENWFGETALMWAAAENHAAAVRLLAEAGADLNAHGKPMTFPRKVGGQTTLPVGGLTPLMYAARQGAMDAARALVEVGADLDAQDPDGSNALALAIINGHYDVAAMLLEKGADPNVADSTGMAALYAVVDMNTLQFMHGRPEPRPSGRLKAVDLMRVLLEHGADPNQPLKTPTLRRHNNASAQHLGAGTTPLLRAASSGDVASMRLLLEHGADPTLTQSNGTTLLMLAAGFGRRGDHNADAQEYMRGTPEELLEAVKVCVEELGADVNQINDQGDAALHWAASGTIIRYLAEHQAVLDVKNKRGHTPLALALARIDRSDRQLRPDAVAALRELTGDVTPTPAAGDTSTAIR